MQIGCYSDIDFSGIFKGGLTMPNWGRWGEIHGGGVGGDENRLDSSKLLTSAKKATKNDSFVNTKERKRKSISPP